MRNPEFLSRMPSRGAPFFLFSPSSSSFPEHSPAGEKEREKQNREREKKRRKRDPEKTESRER